MSGLATLTALSPILGSGVNNVFGLIGAKKQREFSREMASTAYQHDMNMWEKANAYNAPEEQMRRLKAAGLNPNLVYGNGTVTGNTSTQTPKHQSYETPVHTIKFPDMLSMLSMYQDIKGKKLSNDAQSIQNSFLANMQHAKLSQEQMNAIRGLQESGGKYDPTQQKTTYYNEDSKYLKKYNEEIQSRELDNALKKINVDFLRTIPKEFQFMIPLLLKLIR